MKVYQSKEIKNLVLLGNGGSGKTTLAESILFNGGSISRRGEVLNKNTVSDYRDIEHEQESSIYSTLLNVEWKNKKLNIIDTPGADDFIGNVISALQVVDTGIMVLNAKNGVEVGAEILWRHVKAIKKPTVIVVNHLDHESANFEKTIEEAKRVFGNKVILTQYPVNAGEGFDAVIDLILMKMLKWKKEGGEAEELDIPDSEADKAAELQNELIEAAAENDESLMELFFENETLTEDEMRSGITTGLIQQELLPVFCVSAQKNMGVGRLMNFMANVAPLPTDMPERSTEEGKEVKCDPEGPTSLFVFRTSMEAHLGEVSYFKVMSGVLKEGDDLINMNTQGKERLSQLYLVSGKNRTKVGEVHAGDIAATVKLKETKSDHTLNTKGADWKFEAIQYPNPKHRAAIKAKNEADDEKLGEALHRIHDEDPTIILEYSKELKQLILNVQGEYHLNILKWRLDNEFKIETEFLAPKIPYRETITKAAHSMYRHKKQSGGAGQFGEVHMVIEPYEDGKPDPTQFKFPDTLINVNVRGKEEKSLEWGGKLVFYNCIVGGVIDSRFMPAILKGIMEKMEEGPLTGCYARDIRVCVFDGKMHPVDSNEISFKLAGLNAFKDAFKKAGPKIMEPVYNVDVLVPSDRMGDVMSDLQGRRSVIQGMSSESGYEKISAKVPLAEMGNYSTTLRSLTAGRATYSMTFAEYAQVPGDVQEKLLKAYEEEQEEE